MESQYKKSEGEKRRIRERIDINEIYIFWDLCFSFIYFIFFTQLAKSVSVVYKYRKCISKFISKWMSNLGSYRQQCTSNRCDKDPHEKCIERLDGCV